MIFITVGTHEQQFNRLIEYIDELKRDEVIKEEIIMQTGFSTYKPRYCKWKSLITYDEMIKNVREARIVITHGGPASFIMAIQEGKIPIVIPRQEKYNEHINNHQVEFTKAVDIKMGNIILVLNIEDLKDTILNYKNIVLNKKKGSFTNNEKFNKEFEQVVKDLY